MTVRTPASSVIYPAAKTPIMYPGGDYTSLAQILPSNAVFELAACKSDSYDGTSQIWYNRTASPADGSAQASYNMFRGSGSGSSTDDPTFNGAAGTSSAYFSFDGGDEFTNVTLTSLPAFLGDLARTDQETAYSFTFGYRIGSLSAASRILGTARTSTQTGVLLQQDTDGGMTLFQFNGLATGTNKVLAASSITAATDYIITIAVQKSATSGNRSAKVWVDGVSTPTTTALTFNTSIISSPSLNFKWGAVNNTASRVPNGTRLYDFYATNKFLTDDDVMKIHGMMNRRYGSLFF